MSISGKTENWSLLGTLGERIYLEAEKNLDKNELDIALGEIGKAFCCDRIYICERKKNGTFDKTYEWCALAISSEVDLMRNEDSSLYDTWYRQFEQSDECIIQKSDDLIEKDPVLYRHLKSRTSS